MVTRQSLLAFFFKSDLLRNMKNLFAFCFSAIVAAHVVDAIVGGGTLIHEYVCMFVRVCECAFERLDTCRTAFAVVKSCFICFIIFFSAFCRSSVHVCALVADVRAQILVPAANHVHIF